MFNNKFKFIVKEYTSIYYTDGRTFNRRVVGIGILDEETSITFPSPLTNYVRSSYSGKSQSLSSQRNAAYELTKFLNYLREQITNNDTDYKDLVTKGLFGLNLTHGSRYISFLSLQERDGKISGDYIYRIESYLIKFYTWLKENQIIHVNLNEGWNSPFYDLELGTIYPGRDEKISNKLVDFGDNRYDLVLRFIKIAQDVASDIALGICFQFFGGIRVGEVVNITKDAIDSPYYWNEKDLGNEKFIIKIRDRHEQLFSNKKNLQHEQVKCPRNQALLVNPVLSSVYKNHKELLNKMLKQGITTNNKALFISPKTGNPITGKAYKDRFQKIKKEFLKQLSEECKTEDYLFLTDKDWSTHIGRGVFTNFLLQIGATIPEIAIARGDKNINSALAYVEEKNALKLTTEAINNIRKAYENEILDAYLKCETIIGTEKIKQFKFGESLCL
ncbi:hypothetical protein OCD79_00190 [Bacillus wiedmannii]|uniref:hypothetical protein n=1 Tax=Bacillus TaxID=1386 RepID=UPI00089ED585|nr:MULTISPECIES: hypothetical protein [Bacillus]MCU5110013.1 hypothetical protein [Bacillus wiedmannii]MCU5149687.1 hypothetical protein [Bacillus wiedmannii]SEG01412.1 hypothetical protein SAMN04487919_104320 [Bacillus sp. ok061]